MTRSTMSPDRPAHARRTDPLSSHLTLASLGRDDSLKARVLAAAFRLEERSGGRPWNDTQLTGRSSVTPGRVSSATSSPVPGI